MSQINLTGTNSTLSITGSGGHLVVSNLEAGNSSGTQGAVKCSGGGYFGNQVYINSNLDVQTLTFGGVSFNKSYYLNISTGIAGASQALVVDSSRNIVNINSLTASTLTGTLQTASQPNITSLGTLTSLNISGASNDLLKITSSSSAGRATLKFFNDVKGFEIGLRGSANSPNNAFYWYDNLASSYRMIIDNTGNIGIGTITPAYTLDVNGSLNASTLTGTLQTGNQPNITAIGTLSNLTLSSNMVNRFFAMINSTLADGSNVSFVLGRNSYNNMQAEFTFTYSATGSSYLSLGHYGANTMLNILSNGNIGIGTTNPAYMLDINGSLNASTLTGTLQTASQPNITSLGNQLGIAITPTTRTIATGQTCTNCIWYSTSDRRYGMRQVDLDNFVLLCYSAGGTYNDYITWGHTSTIKLNINGTVNTTDLYLISSLVSATATQLNYLAGITAGTATASKALVLDASVRILELVVLTLKI